MSVPPPPSSGVGERRPEGFEYRLGASPDAIPTPGRQRKEEHKLADVVKPKPHAFSVLEPETGVAVWINSRIEQLVLEHHKHLGNARIVVLFKHNWSDDAEGNTPLAQLILVSEMYWRLFESIGENVPPDFILLLNEKVWGRLDEKAQLYVLDEALCYGGERVDKAGDQAEDDTGRPLWRRNKPAFVGFAEPIARHGPQLSKIKAFLRTANATRQLALFAEEEEPEPTGGIVTSNSLPEDQTPDEESTGEVFYYKRVPDLFGDGEDWALRFSAANHSPESLAGAARLTPPQDYIGVVNLGQLEYETDKITLRRAKAALADLQDQVLTAARASAANVAAQ